MWMGTRRYVYNRSLEAVKNGEKINFYDLRNKFVTSKNNENVKKWELETPKDIRAGAIRDMVKNYKTAFTNLRNNNIDSFNLRFCRKKDAPSIEIPKSSLKLENGDIFIYKKYMPEKIRVARREKLKFTIEYDCRLQIKNNKWYLSVPIKTVVKSKEDRYEWCSIDPGVRTFQTVYSEDCVLEIEVRKEILKKLQQKLDNFKSLRDRKIISRCHYKRRERKLYNRLDNLIDDLQHKTCSILTNTYNHIILPCFESQKMTKGNKIRGMNRNMLQLKHYLFKERLKSKCEIMSSTIDICSEEYTSQTCGLCGGITKVEGASVFKCQYCGVTIGRDINGARNIGIKRIKETL